MGITIGDVLSVISTILAVCVSVWAIIQSAFYLFGAKAGNAKHAIVEAPWKTGFVGLSFFAPSLVLTTIVVAVPAPVVKLVGLVLAFMLIMISAIGAAALADVVAERMMRKDSRIQHNQALARASAFLIAACIMPAIGWFVLTPILLVLCAGAGVIALAAPTAENSMEAKTGGS